MSHDDIVNSLQTAVDNNDYQAVKALLDDGADPNANLDDCPFWNLQYPADNPRDNDTRIEISKLFLEYGADPNLECEGEHLYDHVTFAIFNDSMDSVWKYRLRFYKLLIAYGGGGYEYPRPTLGEPIDKNRIEDYSIEFYQCEDGYHVYGCIVSPEGEEIGRL